ncbi:MAG TPA: hypothetical protein IGR64_14135 [Leptolyngbyaceae cyanobacterium M65_K2018_010]|nr:hypothetical protein [Leptolyngbyaceae cyanobacterium M65_K2018_010]
MKRPVSLNRNVRGLILEFALGAAIVALLPIPHAFWFKLLALIALMGLMTRGLMGLWRGHRPDALAKLSFGFSLAGAGLLGLAGWLGGIWLGIIFPWLAGLGPGFAAFALFWGLGQAINHYYLSGLPKLLTDFDFSGEPDET